MPRQIFCVLCWLTTDAHCESQANGSLITATFPQYEPFQLWQEQEQGTPLGWVCSYGGEPGVWVNVSSSSIGTDGTLLSLPGPGGDPEEEGLRDDELAGLRATVVALARRVAALEK